MKNPTWEKLQGQWKQVEGSIQKNWGKLTDDEVAEIKGERERLIGKIQEKYGVAKEEANRQIDEWAARIKLN